MNMIFLAASILLISIWVAERNFKNVHKKVSDRWRQGDCTCRARKEWWGWRVMEFAEDKDADL